MARGNGTKIKVGVDTTGAAAALKKFTRTMKRNATAWNQSLELAQKAFALVSGAIKGMASEMIELSKAASEQTRVEIRAVAAIRQRGKFTKEAFKELQKFNSSIQNSLGIGDESLLQMQGTLAAMGIMPGKLKEATKATIGLAEATGMDLAGAARLVARALTGDVAALKRYNIVARDTTEANQKLQRLFAIAAAQAGTMAKRVAVLDAAWGDLNEERGKSINQSGVLNAAMELSTKTIHQLINFLGQEDGKVIVNEFFSIFVNGAARAVGVLAILARSLNFVKKLRKGSSPGERLLRGETLTRSDVPTAAPPPVPEDDAFLIRLADLAETLARKMLKVSTITKSVKLNLFGGGGGAGAAPLGPSEEEFKAIQKAEKERLKQVAIGKQLANAREVFAEKEKFNAIWELIDADIAKKKQWSDAMAATADKIAGGAANIGGSLVAMSITAAITGEGMKKSMGEIAGTMMIGLGNMLIQTGVAAAILGALSFIPGLQLVTGPPGAAIAGGAIAAATGVAMVFAGHAMGGKVAGGASAPSAGGASRGAVPNGFDTAFRGQEQQGQVININFNGPVGGSGRRIGQALQGALAGA